MVKENIADFERKFNIFKNATKSFRDLLNADISHLYENLSEIIIDGINNGKIQKFEYCTELTLKIIKKFLLIYSGIDANSPKGTIIEFYKAGYCDENDYLILIEIIDQRNNLSHIYSSEMFENIILKLDKYCDVFEEVIKKISDNI